MFTHDGIWRAVDRLADAFGYSPSGLARKAGLDPTTFNKSKRVSGDGKPRWPSTESVAKILAVTGASISDFLALVSDEDDGGSAGPRQTIPVIGYAQAGKAGYFDDAGYPVGDGWDEAPLPAVGSGARESLYALEISGDSMEPLYREGDILIVSPGANIRRGDRVVVKTRKGEVMAKQLLRQNASRVELKSLNPAHDDRILKQDEVAWMARIIWVSQ